MAKTIQFVENVAKKVIQFEKTEATGKQGNLVIERSQGEGYHFFRVYHFGTCILEIDMGRSIRHIFDCITTWHIQSNTDANYLYTILGAFNCHTPFEVGYKPVNGGGYFRYKNNIGEWVTPEGRTSSQW